VEAIDLDEGFKKGPKGPRSPLFCAGLLPRRLTPCQLRLLCVSIVRHRCAVPLPHLLHR